MHHAYLLAKNGGTAPAKECGQLLVPLRNRRGRLWSLQRIHTDANAPWGGSLPDVAARAGVTRVTATEWRDVTGCVPAKPCTVSLLARRYSCYTRYTDFQ